MSAMSSWARLRRLPRAERGVLLGAAAMLPLVAWGLKLLGLRRVQASLARMAPLAARVPDGLAAGDVARMVSAAARRAPYAATCLPTALVLQSLLRRHGIEGELRIGVRKAAAALEAHAWIEHQGVPLIDAADVRERFGPFDLTAGERAPR